MIKGVQKVRKALRYRILSAFQTRRFVNADILYYIYCHVYIARTRLERFVCARVCIHIADPNLAPNPWTDDFHGIRVMHYLASNKKCFERSLLHSRSNSRDKRCALSYASLLRSQPASSAHFVAS